MDPKTELANLLAEADVLSKKADLTAADIARADVIAKRVPILEDALQKRADADERLKALAAESLHTGTYSDETGTFSASSVPLSKAGTVGGQASTRAGKAAGFSEALRKSVAAVSGVPISKAAGIPLNQAITVDTTGGIIADPQVQFSVANLLYRETVAGGSGRYLAQVARDLKAATVKMGDDKPLSTLAFESRTWRMSTIAHVIGPFNRQIADDFDGLLPWVGSEAAYGLDQALSHLILNGGVDEDGQTVTGLMTSTDVPVIPFASDIVTSLHNALTALQIAGVAPSAIVMHPTDWASIELLKDAQGRPLFSNLAGETAARTLFGVPVVVTPEASVGTALTGDLSSVSLVDRGEAQILAFEQGPVPGETYKAGDPVGSLVQRNLLVVRAELRAAVIPTDFACLRKVSLAA